MEPRPPRPYGKTASHAGTAGKFFADEDLQAGELRHQGVAPGRISTLAGNDPVLRVDALVAGYGNVEVLHGIDMHVGAGQSLCLIGPNGSGKSTVLNAVYGLADIRSGRVTVRGCDVTRLAPNARLKEAGIAYILQESSAFPDMTVQENLWLGGYLMDHPKQAREAAERIFERYPLLAARRKQPARVLSGGERRLLEISRALMMEPVLLFADEPTIGLEPRHVEMVFEVFGDLQHREGKSIVMAEQNARKGLEFADLGYLLLSGKIAKAAPAAELLQDPEVARLFLGG